MQKKETFLKGRLKGIGYATKGAWLLIKKEDSIKIQVVISIIITIAGFYYNISSTEWILQTIVIALVLSVEGLNTAIENILDFNPIEMSSSLSDSYSFIQNNPEPIDFCYQFIDSKNSTVNTERMPPKKGNNFDARLQKLQDARRNVNIR